MSNNNWGAAPQKSDTASVNRPKWGDTAPQKSDTASAARPGWGQGGPQKSDTGTPNVAQGASLRYDVPVYSVFVLNKVMYRSMRVISEESGEAKVFEVEADGKRYALKMYRYGIRPDHAVLDRIMKLRGSGLLVDIYDHGTWLDDKQGVDFDYEVMQLCPGGSLATVQLEGKEEQLKEIALKMTAAIDFLHRKGIVHRDVKPANFMFTDEARTKFVLTDWGFAKILDKDGRAVSDDGRTKIYTAPELYINIPGQATYADAKVDFYSMGMSLLALWRGEGLLIADEQKLVRQKLDEELPYPSRKEMSEHMLSLIKALTRNNPEKRAGFEDIKRWASGEIIYHDTAADNVAAEYRIVFSGEKNLIAHNHEELGAMMWDNQELAKKYLYSDKIAGWLEDAGRPEMALRMREITEMEYPSNTDTGLYAACLELMPDMPFYGVKGDAISTQEQLAKELFTNVTVYKDAVGSYEEKIWEYCRAVGLGNEIKHLAAKGASKSASLIFELAFRLDKTLPYPVPVKNNGKVCRNVRNLTEYLEAFESADGIYFYYQSRCDFLQWLENVDPVMCGRARTMLSKHGSDVDRDALVHYAMLPGVGFDDVPLDKSKLPTPEKIAEFIARQECLSVETGKYIELVDWKKFKGSALEAYLLSKEKYQKQISYANYCMELNSADNKKKAAPYGAETAGLKILAGWHGSVLPVTLHGHTFTQPHDLDKADLSTFTEKEQNFLVHWLGLFFQEAPNADYRAKSYTARALEMYEFIDSRLTKSTYVQRCNKQPSSDVDGAVSRNKRAWAKVRIVQVLAILLCFIPMLCVCGAMAYLSVTTGSTPIENAMKSIGHVTAIIMGIIAAICCVDGGIFGMALGGIAAYALTEVLFKFLAPVVPWLVIVLLLVTVIFFGRKIFIKIGKRFGSSDLSLSEIKQRHRAGLAFNTRHILLPGKDMDYPVKDINENTDYASSHISGLIKNALLMLALSAGGIFLCGWVVKNYDNAEVVGVVATPIEGTYIGDVHGTPSAIKLYQNKDGIWEADMTINYRAGKTQQVMVSKEKTESPGFMYLPANPGVTLSLEPVQQADADVRAFTGTYVNSKGNRRTVNYKQTETSNEMR